jgi:hypothetical protein
MFVDDFVEKMVDYVNVDDHYWNVVVAAVVVYYVE